MCCAQGPDGGPQKAQDRVAGRTSFLSRPSGGSSGLSGRPSASGTLPPPQMDVCPPFPLVPLLKVCRTPHAVPAGTGLFAHVPMGVGAD